MVIQINASIGSGDDMFLDELKAGERGRILAVGGEGALRQHFLDMGVVPGSRITLVKFAPLGDPIEFRIHDYELTREFDTSKQKKCLSALVIIAISLSNFSF